MYVALATFVSIITKSVIPNVFKASLNWRLGVAKCEWTRLFNVFFLYSTADCCAPYRCPFMLWSWKVCECFASFTVNNATLGIATYQCLVKDWPNWELWKFRYFAFDLPDVPHIKSFAEQEEEGSQRRHVDLWFCEARLGCAYDSCETLYRF